MAFQLSDEHRAIRQAVREFGKNEIKPVAKEHDQEGSYPIKLRKKAAEFDLVAPHIPPEYDGAGVNLVEAVLVTEEFWRADQGLGVLSARPASGRT